MRVLCAQLPYRGRDTAPGPARITDNLGHLDALLREPVRRAVGRDPFGPGEVEEAQQRRVDLAGRAHRLLAPPPLELAVHIDQPTRVDDVIGSVDDVARVQLVPVPGLGEHVVGRAGDDVDAKLRDGGVVDGGAERARRVDVGLDGVDLVGGGAPGAELVHDAIDPPLIDIRDDEAGRWLEQSIRMSVAEAAKLLDITHLLERKPKALSGGQRQRVAVGRAIVRQPKVFLFDEPLSNLDAKLRVQMRTEISKLHLRLQATMIYVTHDQTEAMTMGDRIVVMKDGLVQQVAPPLELYEHPVNKFVAGFIGSPPMNFMEGTVEAFLTIAQTHARYGTTGMFPTTLSGKWDDFLRTLNVYEEAAEENVKGSEFLGLHIEGPYLAMSQKGA